MQKMKRTKTQWRLKISHLFLSLSILGGVFTACQKSELESDAAEVSKPAFTMELALGGGLDAELLGEEVRALELASSEESLRSAGINLQRDPQSRKFKLNLDISKDKELPVVVACRRTSKGAKQVFVGQTRLSLLSGSNGQATRKFRVEKKGVNFYLLNDDGSRSTTTFDQLQRDEMASYEVKLFVGAKLEETTHVSGGKRYAIHYGLANTVNESQMVMMKDDGVVSFNSVQEKIPFVSDWTKVEFARNAEGEVGLSNNYADRIDGLEPIRLKAQGSILMFKISNEMSESTIHLESVRVYSESLTANTVYAYDSQSKDFTVRPVARFKKDPKEAEKYFNSILKPNVSLSPKTGTKTFFFWAQVIPAEYFAKDEWIPTSIVTQIKEQQGAQGDNRKYWFNVPLLKTYDRLHRLHNGRVTKTELKFEDGTPMHPMNLMAHRFVWDGDLDTENTNWQVQWRPDPIYWMSAYQNGDERSRVLISSTVARYWRRRPVTLEFGKIEHANPMTFRGTERAHYAWRTTSIRELAALFPTGVNQTEIDKTVTQNNPVIIKEQAKMEDYAGDTDFYTILQRPHTTITYAIRFLRKTKDGQFYMTPYTAAYRYDHKSVWRNQGEWIGHTSNDNSTIEIRMRPLGGTTNQYNEHDGKDGYYSPTFSEERLRKLFDMVKEASRWRWWLDSPLREDDVVREYPALGYWGTRWTLYDVGSKLSIMTHDATKSEKVRQDGLHNIIYHARDNNFKFDWTSTHDYAPVILLAERKIIQKNSN